LSDEVFYEIFDYLDGCHIYEAFSNLNHRFEQVLNSSLLLFKIYIDDIVLEKLEKNQYKPIIVLNKKQIFSIELWLSGRGQDFFSSFIIDSLLSRLESFAVKWVNPDVIIPLLVNLAFLPHLVTLTIDTQHIGTSLSDIYRLIFVLPALKHNDLNTNGSGSSISLPIAINQQSSTIETLAIAHPCTFNELACLTSYTPKLRHLTLDNTDKTDPNIEPILPIILSNLTRIDIHLHHETFDKLELIITKIGSKLNVLCCSASKDAAFVDGHRWKQFILRYLPDLKKFYMSYEDTVRNKSQFSTYPGEQNQFSSSFWIERQWVFAARILGEYITYSIGPYRYIENNFPYKINYRISFRKRWYDYPEDIIVKSSIELSKSAKLTIRHFYIKKLIAMSIKRVLTRAQIYHLEFYKSKIFADLLIRIIDLLPDLITLKIDSLSCRESANSSKNKISKVYIQKMDNMDELDCLLAICPYTNYLQIEHLNNTDVKLVLDHVLTKIHHDCNDQLRSLYFGVPTADDQMIKTLQKMIDDEKFLINYTIKRIGDHVYLQWK
jgi:hypothetical protein